MEIPNNLQIVKFANNKSLIDFSLANFNNESFKIKIQIIVYGSLNQNGKKGSSSSCTFFLEFDDMLFLSDIIINNREYLWLNRKDGNVLIYQKYGGQKRARRLTVFKKENGNNVVFRIEEGEANIKNNGTVSFKDGKPDIISESMPSIQEAHRCLLYVHSFIQALSANEIVRNKYRIWTINEYNNQNHSQ